MDMEVQPSDTLRALNEDVLRVIMEMLRPGRCLRPLSLTCKWLRAACCPILFRECVVPSKVVDGWRQPAFIPPSLWPYLCHLSFAGPFERDEIRRLRILNLQSIDPDWKEEVLRPHRDAVKAVSETLQVAVTSMPSLYSVNISTSNVPHSAGPRDVPGVSPYILAAILSASQVRQLGIAGPLCDPGDELPQSFTQSMHARLSSLVYRIHYERSALQVPHVEGEELSLILGHVHDCLEILFLPGESAPIERMGAWQWPSLEELYLRGERATSSRPLVQMLSEMPRLRTLALMLAEPGSGETPPI
ncbi:hypothetical protein FKP32DRAFT_233788 [Trametes sanguinea]|nr:hypothetical protein FKP32DRAFT_233788 [Trametes sanguinea]